MHKKRTVFWSLIFILFLIVFGYDMTSRTLPIAVAQCAPLHLQESNTLIPGCECVKAYDFAGVDPPWYVCLCFS